MVIFLKLVLRVLKTVSRNQKNLIFKNHLKQLKWKCFNVSRQKYSHVHIESEMVVRTYNVLVLSP